MGGIIMIGGNIRKEVLKRENRYKFYDENNKLIKEEFYYKDVDTGIERPKPYFVNLITYDKECFNARACFEKQIGVQTSGSENYKMFNTVLKSEELSVASTLLNNDKNKL